MDLSPSSPPIDPLRRGSASSVSDNKPIGPPHSPFARDRRFSAQPERRGSAASLTVPSRKSSVSPDDGYDYGDVGPSPEGSATTERDNAKLSTGVPELRLDGRPSGFGQFDQEKGVEELKPNIYERQAGSRRAKLPDQENNGLANGVTHATDEERQGPAAPQPRSRISRLPWRQRAADPDNSEGVEKTKLRHVRLHWGKEDVEGAQRLIVESHSPSITDSASNSQNHVVWQHSEVKDQSFDKLGTFVNRSRSQGLQESEIGLTRRLLKRVRKTAERDFVGGSFLTPLTLRYDILDDSRYSVDKCCIFLSFPYFDIHKPQPTKKYRKGDEEHPTRTLLQSRYRLNETAERDKSQCIRMLKGEALEACLDTTNRQRQQTMRRVTEELIYVPQFWALIMGVDRMITTGPISDLALQGSCIKIKDHAVAGQSRRCSLVRISFINRGKLEELTYPIEQCNSWFGLLNKHQQIRNVLKKDIKKNAKADGKELDPHEYKLEIKGHVIDGRTWPSVQQSAESEVIGLWMRTPKRRVPKVSVKMDGDPDSPSGEHTDDDPYWEEREASEAAPGVRYTALDTIPVVSAFLEWQILDEFGEPDDCPLEEKLNRFLNAIYRSLPAICSNEAGAPSTSGDTRFTRGTDMRKSARTKIKIEGKTCQEVSSWVSARASSTTADHQTIDERLLGEYQRLFDMFIPESHDGNSAPIQLFWGTIYEIMVRRPYLEQLLEKTKEITLKAEQIHLGVYHQVHQGEQGAEHAVSGSAVLLSSIVDAFGAVFNMLVETARDARVGHPQMTGQALQCGKKVLSNCDEACRLLEQAKNELISEATGAAAGENIGPVLTPEAILIMLMERLTDGVSGAGSVDVINIFEECLEHLALSVRDRASRRLLQKVNAFEEEISIVNDVLLEQQKVLLDLSGYLNPASFKNPSTARKMRFDFEKKGIERILLSIREQLHDCNELRERAKVLAKQNVQLVETLQDDNGRAIFIFTFITVLFLPLTFVAGFFGMNLADIASTTETTSRFWYIGLPLTGGIMALCGCVVFAGEDLWFALKLMPRNLIGLMQKKKEKLG